VRVGRAQIVVTSLRMMPSSVCALFAAADLDVEGVVRWGRPLSATESGVYAVALTDDPNALSRTRAAPISPTAIDALMSARPELTLDGRRPSRDQLTARIEGFWLPDEPVLYVGLATSLRSRIGAFYRTPIGARRPHSGGWFLKTLEILDQLHVHFARVHEFDAAEVAMLDAFIGGVSRVARAGLTDPERPWPFANLEIRRGDRKLRKRHGISGARGDIARRPNAS
jgi:hypothetical protein